VVLERQTCMSTHPPLGGLHLCRQTGVSDIPLTANGEKTVKEMGPKMMGSGSEHSIVQRYWADIKNSLTLRIYDTSLSLLASVPRGLRNLQVVFVVEH
jgi:hypothetical protein